MWTWLFKKIWLVFILGCEAAEAYCYDRGWIFFSPELVRDHTKIQGNTGHFEKETLFEKETSFCKMFFFFNWFWWKWKTLLYFPEFWYGREPILVKKKDPPVYPWILVRSRTNSGEKEWHPRMWKKNSKQKFQIFFFNFFFKTLNFGMVKNQFWWKRMTL